MTSYIHQLEGPWIAPEKIPASLRRTFDLSRDEYIKRQLLAMETEKQQESGRGSGMIGRESFHHRLHPPPNIRDPVDRDLFNAQWLAEQRDAALKQAQAFQQLHEHVHARAPERSR